MSEITFGINLSQQFGNVNVLLDVVKAGNREEKNVHSDSHYQSSDIDYIDSLSFIVLSLYYYVS